MNSQSHTYSHLLAFVLDHPWALTDSMRAMVAHVLARHLAGHVDAQNDFERIERPARQPAAKAVAVIPIHGLLAPRINLMSDMSGGCTYEELRGQLRAAVANPAVSTIILDIDSPGGSCAGASEFAQDVLKARARKPVIAVAEFQMASAAYWIGSCATEIVAPVSALVGSIGVYALHEDLSKALEQEGVKLTYISAGKYKVDGNPSEPLSDTARARIKAQVDATYARFVGDVAEGRRVPETTVRARYGQGAVVNSAEALSLGMVDRIESLGDCVERVLREPPPLQPLRVAPSLPASSSLAYYQQQQQTRSMKSGRVH